MGQTPNIARCRENRLVRRVWLPSSELISVCKSERTSTHSVKLAPRAIMIIKRTAEAKIVAMLAPAMR